MSEVESKEDLLIVQSWMEKPRVLETKCGIPVKEYYTPDDVNGANYDAEIGNPGEFPYTRGIHPNMYRGKIWTRRVFCGVGTPEYTNKKLKYQLSHGQSGIIITPDIPTNHGGVDPDHPIARGFAAIQGAPIHCIQDTDQTFADIDLGHVSVAFQWNNMSALVTQACFIASAQKRGYDVAKLRGSIINEPLHSYFSNISAPQEDIDLQLKISTDITEYCTRHMPLWHPQVLNGYDMSQTGIVAHQELAFTLALARAYIGEALKRDLDIDSFANRIMLVFTSDMDFFEQVAKFRAARRIWAKMMRDEFSAKDKKTWRAFITTHTDGSSLTAQQPVNNIVRITLEVLAAALGGVQSMDPCGYDEGHCIPSFESALTSLNIQNIVAYETGIVNTADPLGGSYYLEHLTNEIEKKAREYLQEIEDHGGIVNGIKTGWVRQEVEKAQLQREKEKREKKRIVVGVNELVVPKDAEVSIPITRDTWLDTRAEQDLVEIFRKFKASRDTEKVKEGLKLVRRDALEGKNLMPSTIEAVKAKATMSETLGVIRQAYGMPWDPFGMVNAPSWWEI
ncbi:MAG: methylmalonyl-CoA mutase family protein [Syntrophales bacterium]